MTEEQKFGHMDQVSVDQTLETLLIEIQGMK